jgi:phosphoglycerate dehydrogenase-like enzyme
LAIKVLLTYDYGKENMNKLKSLGYDITLANEKDISYSENVKDTEVLVCYNPFNTLDISLMTKLKWIQLTSTGIDQLPIQHVKKEEIIVTNNRGGYSIPMGEWVVMKTLELLKNSYGLYRNQMSKLWKMDTGLLELYGKTIGFIGTGSIAIESAKRLKGFGVRILGLNTTGKAAEYFDTCFSMKEIDNMLLECDVVIITAPSTKQTLNLINKERFKSFKQGAFLVNVARGNIINEIALIENLNIGKIAGAALDVFEEEPLSQESVLWNFHNVIITPHNSWISEMRNIRRWNVIYDNLRRYINREELKNKVNLEKGY